MAGGLGWCRGAVIGGALALLAGCATVPVAPVPPTMPTPAPAYPANVTPAESARNFISVIRRMEPAIERECVARRTMPINCDFMFVVDDTPGQGINAFQTVDEYGRPILGFTLALIAEARNPDEIAFVVGHEAAHHILNHLEHKAGAASAAAVILGSIATMYGGNEQAIDTARRIGASVGARYYSREWELQADYLGAILALNAGFDPENGSKFFLRISDPGNHILGTHPSNAARIAQVQRAIADVRQGRVR